MIPVIQGFALLQYGTTMHYEQRRSAELALLPSGELHPPHEYWLARLRQCSTVAEFADALGKAQTELRAWQRRPDPPPEGETLEQFKDRIIEHAGWPPKEVAFALRCTPTLVRQTRLERERNPDTGYEEGSLEHARALLGNGCSLRQVAVLTGIPKSTLHRLCLQKGKG